MSGLEVGEAGGEGCSGVAVLRWQATLGVWERGKGQGLGEVADSEVANLGREGDCQVHCDSVFWGGLGAWG